MTPIEWASMIHFVMSFWAMALLLFGPPLFVVLLIWFLRTRFSFRVADDPKEEGERSCPLR